NEVIENVAIEIYNAKGQKVKQLQMTNDELRAGSVHWDGTDSANQPVTSGVYLYQLKAGGKTLGQKKCLLLK
ncbi:MAG: gliding motility-associated C-terminal domain-containing protein, partial [Candidatus Cloacimonetes bacterium]|nr:gliding motility-associated C-terminal domain-containing protein [Candidatus Cloacimonadota bacterium]